MSSIITDFEDLEKKKAVLIKAAEALSARLEEEFPNDPRLARAILEFPHGVYSPVSEIAGCPVFFDYPTLAGDIRKLLYDAGVKS